MKKSENKQRETLHITEKTLTTSPIKQEKLVSKVNSLTFNSCANSLSNPQNKVFNNEKNLTLNYKYVVDEVVKIPEINNINDFYTRIYSMITQCIDSNFMAIGIHNEKSGCIDLKLKDKLENFYSTKVFLKEEENPIVKSFSKKEILFQDDVKFLKLSYFKNKVQKFFIGH